MLHLKSRLDNLEANATSLISKENSHAYHQDLIRGIETWKEDWGSAYETLHYRESPLNRAKQKNNKLYNMSNDDDCRLSYKSDFEPSIEYDTKAEGNCPSRCLVENKIVEDIQLQGRKARATNTPTRNDNDDEYPGTGYVDDDSLSSNENSGGQQSRMMAAGEPSSLRFLESQNRNCGQKAKSGNWAKLWDQLAELAGIYDY